MSEDDGCVRQSPNIRMSREDGKAPTPTRWIYINKPHEEHPNYRSRLAAREINIYKRDDVFAATLPPEAFTLIWLMVATCHRDTIVMVNVISGVFVRAKIEREVYVQLLKEDMDTDDEQLCGRLGYSMYGTRRAAQNLYNECSSQLVRIGFQQGKASLCLFHRAGKGIRTYVHGDDYDSAGEPEQLTRRRRQLEQQYTGKTQTLGSGRPFVPFDAKMFGHMDV